MVFVCRYNNPVRFSFMTYYRVCNKSNTMGATCGAETAHPSEYLSSPSVLAGSCCSIYCFMFNVLQIIVCTFVPLLCLYCPYFDLRLLVSSLVTSNFSYLTRRTSSDKGQFQYNLYLALFAKSVIIFPGILPLAYFSRLSVIKYHSKMEKIVR